MATDRSLFWAYCIRTANAARHRAKQKKIPFSIDAYFIDQLLIDQDYCCAISSLPLKPPVGGLSAFGPSLDRIVPSLGYVPGNVRIVNYLINSAMADWGEENFLLVAKAIGAKLGWKKEDFMSMAKAVEGAQEHHRNMRPRMKLRPKKLSNDVNNL